MIAYFSRIRQIIILNQWTKKLIVFGLIVLLALTYVLQSMIKTVKSPINDIEYLGVVCRQPIFSPYDSLSEVNLAGTVGNKFDVTRTIKLEMNDRMRFEPEVMNVVKGETIRFFVKNSGKLRHEFAIGTESKLKIHELEMLRAPKGRHEHADMLHLNSGEEGEIIWRFLYPGRVSFACLQPGHYSAGMKGIILVKLE